LKISLSAFKINKIRKEVLVEEREREREKERECKIQSEELNVRIILGG
jgi:hypothetical protein